MEKIAALGALWAGVSDPCSETESYRGHKLTGAAEQCACCFKSRMLLQYIQLLKAEC